MSGADLDLSRAFDDAFVGEHDGPPVAHHLARARRYVRLRRVLASLAVACVVAVGFGGLVVVDSQLSADDEPPATDETHAPRPQPTILTEYDFPDGPEDLARLSGWATGVDGELLLGDDVEVVDQVELPRGAGFADRSYGLDVVKNGTELWIWLPWDADSVGPGGEMAQSEVRTEPVAGTTFRDWLDGVLASQEQHVVPPEVEERTAQMERALQALDADRRGHFTLTGGAEVLERVDNPMGLMEPFESTALRLLFKGEESWWLVSPEGSLPVVENDQRGLTFESWLARELDHHPTYEVDGPMPPLDELVDGMPRMRAVVDVLERVDNPLGVAAPARSVAYRAFFKGREWWFLWELGPSGFRVRQTTRVAGDGYPTFEAFLADQRSRVPW